MAGSASHHTISQRAPFARFIIPVVRCLVQIFGGSQAKRHAKDTGFYRAAERCRGFAPFELTRGLLAWKEPVLIVMYAGPTFLKARR